MLIIRPDSLPRLWWLFPWSVARQLHKNAVALKAMTDRLDNALTMQSHIIVDQSEEIANLRQHLRNLEDSITRGAITPDAAPYNAGSERDHDEPYTRADDLRISE
jgi:hypothetical protein